MSSPYNLSLQLADFLGATFASPASGVAEIRTLGYYAAGDRGGARYRRAEANELAQLVCADGSRWQIAEPEITPLMFGAKSGDDAFDDSPSMQAAFDMAGQLGRGIYVPPGCYGLHSMVVVRPYPGPCPSHTYLKPGPTYRFDQQAICKAVAAMPAMFSFGDDSFDALHRNSTLYGGLFDCNDFADVGVWIRFCNTFRMYDAEVRNFRVHGFRAGSVAAPQRSYEALFIGCKTWREPPRGRAHINSAGIFFENCGDSHALNCVIGGAQVGIGGIDVWDSKFTNVHVWNFVENGELLYGFDLNGDNVLTGCQVDGPFKYAYRFRERRNSLNACNVNYGAYGGESDHAVAIRLEPSAPQPNLGPGGVTAMNCNWKAADSSLQLLAEVEGERSYFISQGNKFFNVTKYDVAYGPTEPCMVGMILGATQDGPAVLKRRGVNIASAERKGGPGSYIVYTNNPIPDDGPLLLTVRQYGVGVDPLFAVEDAALREAFMVHIQFYDRNGVLQDPHSFSIVMFGAG